MRSNPAAEGVRGEVKTLFVGNLPWRATEDDLQAAFAPHCEVHNVRVVVDRETGRSRGFGFVEVADEDVERVVAALNGSLLGGRPLTVNEAKPRPPRT